MRGLAIGNLPSDDWAIHILFQSQQAGNPKV
jgi:hypothetical protein